MNKKQLTLLIVLAVVLGGLGWVAYRKQQDPYKQSTAKMGGKLLPDLPINDVTHVAIQHTNVQVNLVKKGETWTVKERGDYPANFGNLSDFLRKLWELKVAKPVTVGPSRLATLDLVAPDKGNGTLVELKDAAGKPLQSVLLGAKHMRESSGDAGFGGGSWPDGRYVMVGTNLQSVALVTEAFSNIEPKPEDWINKDWFKVEKHKTITLTSATNSWKLARETETGEWKLADAKPGEQLDTGKSSGVTSALSFPSFNDVAVDPKPDQTGLDKPVVAKIETFDGFEYTLKVGSTNSAENYHVQIAVTSNLPKERTPGKDEKPEDKERLDKEFKEKTDKLQEKLKTEKAYDKLTYLVSKWTIEPLLKERKDLLAEKKEEPKPAEAAQPETKPDEPKKEPSAETKPVPKPEEPKKDEAKSEEQKKDDAKPEEPKKDEPKADKD
jgi:hypothetical protein